MADVIRTLTIRSKTEGVTQTVGDMDKLAASTDKVVKASVEQERTTLSVEKAYNRLQRQLDDAFRAQENMARVQKTLEQAQAQGLVTAQRSSELMQAAITHYNTSSQAINLNAAATQKLTAGMSALGSVALQNSKATEQMTRGMTDAGRAAAGATGVIDKYGNANKGARFELINLSRQIQDVGVSLQSGQALFTVFIQQGTQIADVFATAAASGRSLGKELVNMLTSFFTPGRIIVAAFLAAVGGIVTAFMLLRTETKTLESALKDQDDVLKVVSASYKDAANSAGVFIEQSKVITQLKAQESLIELQKQLDRTTAAFEKSSTRPTSLPSEIPLPIGTQAIENAKVANTEFAALNKVINDFNASAKQAADVQQLRDGIAGLGVAARDANPALAAAAAEALKTADEMGRTALAVAKADAVLALLAGTATEAQRALLGLANAVKMTAFDNFVANTRDAIEVLRLEAQMVGKSASAVAALRVQHEADKAARQSGNPVAQQVVDSLKKEIAAATAAKEAAEKNHKAYEDGIKVQEKLLEIRNELTREGKLVLLTSEDAQIAERLKDIYPDIGDALKSAEADQLRFNNSIERAKDLTSDFVNTFVQGMVSGKDATEALSGAMAGLGQAIARSSLNKLSEQLVGKVGEGGEAGTGITGLIGGLAPQLGALGGPVGAAGGAAVGIGISLLGKLFGGNNKEAEQAAQKQAEELRKAQEAWAKMTQQVADFNREAAGLVKGDLRTSLEGLRGTFDTLSQAAVKAKDFAAVARLVAVAQAGEIRLLNEFTESLPLLQQQLAGEGGLKGATSSAVKAVQDFRQQMLALKDNLQQASELTTSDFFTGQQWSEFAALGQQAALAMLSLDEQTSEVHNQIVELNGTASALGQVLTDLGMSAEDAAAAINDKLNVALDEMRTHFLEDLTSKINELTGAGFVNQGNELVRQVAQLRSDAAELGIQTELIDRFYLLSAQKIVDSNKLAGEEFDLLAKQLGLADSELHAFAEAVEEVAEVAKRSVEEIAKAIQSNEDRLFNALHRSDSISDQLARFDLAARREREQEQAAGGQALASLERALQQERNNIIADYNAKQLQEQLEAQKKAADEAERARQQQLDAERQAAEERARILEEAQRFLEGALRNISEFITHFLAGAQSYLSPFQRLQQARASFAQQFSQAVGGNRDALSGITQNAQDVIEATRAYYGSAAAGQSIIADLISQLQGLPNQVSAEEFIVDGLTDPIEAVETSVLTQTQILQAQMSALQTAINSGSASAIASALLPMFSSLDTNLDDLLDFNEFQTGLAGMASNSALREMFTRLDTDNSGSISRLELINQAAQGISSDTDQLNPIQQNTDETASNTLQALNNLTAAVSNLSQIITQTSATNSGINTSNQQLVAINTGINSQVAGQAQTAGLLDLIRGSVGSSAGSNATAVSLLTSMNTYLSIIASWAPGTNHAMGGRITGGIPGKDSVHGMLMPGEFVVRAPVAQQSPWLDDFNRTGIMPNAANDNGGVIAAIHNLERTLLRGVSALIETQLQAAGIISRPIQEANKITRTRRGEKKKVA